MRWLKDKEATEVCIFPPAYLLSFVFAVTKKYHHRHQPYKELCKCNGFEIFAESEQLFKSLSFPAPLLSAPWSTELWGRKIRKPQRFFICYLSSLRHRTLTFTQLDTPWQWPNKSQIRGILNLERQFWKTRTNHPAYDATSRSMSFHHKSCSPSTRRSPLLTALSLLSSDRLANLRFGNVSAPNCKISHSAGNCSMCT